MGANLQYVANPRVSLGLNVYNQSVVLLSTTSFMATFGYRVPINRNNIISFGLSGGAFSNRIDLDGLTQEQLDDPLILQANNSWKMDGQFGINFTHRRLTLGFSLLRLFENNAFVNEGFSDIKFSELKNKAVTAAYVLPLGKNVEFMPYLMYRFSENYNFFEATGVVTFRNLISIGGFYRQDYGPGFLIRLKIKSRFEIGYGHEFASAQAKNFLGGSQEVQFKWKLGEKAEDLVTKREEKTIDSTATEKAPVVAEKPAEAKTDSTQIAKNDKPVTNTTPPVTEPVVTDNAQNNNAVSEPVPAETTPAEPEVQPKVKYVLVIGTFHSSSNAVAFVRTAKAKGVRTEVIYSQEMGYYYVIAPEYDKEDPTLEELLSIRDKIPFKDAWYKSGVKK
jgi:type IX secretion system PorP/SprF family membrane protein